jgi:hypothetical protein
MVGPVGGATGCNWCAARALPHRQLMPGPSSPSVDRVFDVVFSGTRQNLLRGAVKLPFLARRRAIFRWSWLGSWDRSDRADASPPWLGRDIATPPEPVAPPAPATRPTRAPPPAPRRHSSTSKGITRCDERPSQLLPRQNHRHSPKRASRHVSVTRDNGSSRPRSISDFRMHSVTRIRRLISRLVLIAYRNADYAGTSAEHTRAR